MLCNRCRRNQEDHSRTSENIKLINRLLGLTESQEETFEKAERLSMLHRNAKSNYKVLVDLEYIMSEKCTSENCAPN